jgi:hypothetical protein
MVSRIFRRRFGDFTLDCINVFSLMRKSRGNFSAMGKLREALIWQIAILPLCKSSSLTSKDFSKAGTRLFHFKEKSDSSGF